MPLEHHRQRSSGAAGHTQLAIIYRAVVVVRLLLVPHGGEQWLYADAPGAAGIERLIGSNLGMSLQILQLLLINAKPVFHVGRHAVNVLDGAVTIGKHGPGTVITRNDDEVVVGVEDVVHGGSRLVGIHFLLVVVEIEIHLSDIFVLDLTDLQIDKHKAFQDTMIENEIDLIRPACNDHLLLSADISESLAEFEEELAQVIDESF